MGGTTWGAQVALLLASVAIVSGLGAIYFSAKSYRDPEAPVNVKNLGLVASFNGGISAVFSLADMVELAQ